MIFNILIYSTIKDEDYFIDYLSQLKYKNIIFIKNASDILPVIKNETINIILFDVENYTKLNTIISEIPNKDIPIMLNINQEQCINLDSTWIYDTIDLDNKKNSSLNKIKFCYSFYKKEYEHQYIENLTKLSNRARLILDIRNPKIGINSLAIIDINSFKEINDFFGHKIGDKILIGVSNLISENIKNYTNEVLFYKFPSDTYCLANISLDENTFKYLIINILNTINTEVFIEDQHEIDTRATAGITFSPKNNKLITADIALQAAKKQHKNYLVFYEELDTLQKYQNNMIWTKKLKTAIKEDNIVVYFQPLINNKNNVVDKYECLVRMIDGDKVISPFFFLDISKKINLYSKITQIVVLKSFQAFENLPFEFSLNVSYEDIENPRFLDFIKENLKIYNVASRVVWEILEDEGIRDYDVLFNFIKEVKKLGCKVAIDDFGSGYSNFEHLLKMDIDYLKIDASLIKNIATDENSYKVTKTIIDFANSLNLKTISEFVENCDIFNITKKLGSHYSQGYYFSAPIPKPILYDFNDH